MCRKLALAATIAAVFAMPAFAQEARQKPSAPQAPSGPTRATAAERAQAERSDPIARAAFWNAQVVIDPTDTEAGVKFAAALRALGQHEEAVASASRVLVIDPRNIDALLEGGRARIAQGQAFYGLDFLRQAQALAPRDWRVPSLLGVAYQQVERYADAKLAFEAALSLSPDNPAVLSNFAMLHAARGDARQAEALLRRALERPGATVQIRQNLAYVLGLQGKIAEAEPLLRADLPPEIANNNLSYLRALSGEAPAAQQRTWDSLRR